LFVEKANEVCLSIQFLPGHFRHVFFQLRDVLIAQSVQSLEPDGSLKLDVYHWLNKVTLDFIGHAGTWHV
jgi:hypothetical protein